MESKNISILLEEKIGQKDTSPKCDLNADDIFHILQNQRRRQVLQYLANQAEECTLRELSEQIAAWENSIPIEQITSDERQRVYIALYQVHLPKLDELGVIEYNQARGTVRRTDRADKLDQYRLASPSISPISSSYLSNGKKNEGAEPEVRRIGVAIGIGVVIGVVVGQWGIQSRKFWMSVTGLTLLTTIGAYLSRVKPSSFQFISNLFIDR